MPGRSKNEKYNNIKKKKIETPLEELCRGQPFEFKEFMEYCRALKFEQEPNYRTCLNFFESCMNRNNLDRTLMDYTWKQNRLSKDKEALKNSVMNVIRKKADAPVVKKEEAKISGGQTPTITPAQMNGSPGMDQGYGSAIKREAVGDYSNQYGAV